MVRVHEIQKEAQSIMPFIDLYGSVLLFTILKQYPFVSWRDKTIPQEGSPTRLTKDIEMEKAKALNVKKLIAHKDGKTTIFTDKGVYQFFAAGQQVKN
jgi:hypothetical protein